MKISGPAGGLNKSKPLTTRKRSTITSRLGSQSALPGVGLVRESEVWVKVLSSRISTGLRSFEVKTCHAVGFGLACVAWGEELGIRLHARVNSNLPLVKTRQVYCSGA